MDIYKITPCDREESCIWFGGDYIFKSEWPRNPDGEYLALILTLDCKKIKTETGYINLPDDGFIHVFSTYDSSAYFLDLITYDDALKQSTEQFPGYTLVVHSTSREKTLAPGIKIPRKNAELKLEQVDPYASYVGSLLTQQPVGRLLSRELETEYYFLGQIYSSDCPAPYQDALYLTDATACLLMKKKPEKDGQVGMFFVCES